MLTWRLAKEITQPENQSWKILTTALGENPHPDRIRGFLLSREALRLAFFERGINLQIPELQLLNFNQLIDENNYILSLSHTKEWGAAVIADKSRYRSIGIDIEKTDREVKPEIFQRISHAQDFKTDSVRIWSLKEAIFKTLMNTSLFEKNVAFGDIKISSHSWEHSGGLKGSWSTQDKEGLIVALAWMEI
jgi:phosphopantetheinyl transferase (holo-ACP synthase)